MNENIIKTIEEAKSNTVMVWDEAAKEIKSDYKSKEEALIDALRRKTKAYVEFMNEFSRK